MASNLDYLSATLEPLEEKVKAYLQAEKALHQANQASTNAPQQTAAPAAAPFEQRPGTASPNQVADEQRQHQSLQDDLVRLRQEIIDALPTRDAWVKVNLGYGPSRVGAWAVAGQPDQYELRIVH